MRSLIFSTVIMMFSAAGAAFADAPLSCLQRASDQQLLDEVASRMGGTSTPTQAAQVSARCDSSAYFNISVTNLETGKEAKESFGIGSASLCDKAVAVVVRKTGANAIQANLMVAFCDNSAYFTRLLLKTTGEIQKLGSEGMGSMSKCEAAMNQI